jgi:hypothetical protein
VTRTTAPSTADLEDRYGRARLSPRRRLGILVAAVVALAALVVAWVIWSGLGDPAATVDYRDTGYQKVSDREISVRFEVTAEPGQVVECAAQALNDKFETVGWKVVQLPASPERTRGFVETIRTTNPPNTALIYRCWLP